MTNREEAIRRLIEAARPIAKRARNYRHFEYEVSARVPASLLIELADALAAVDEANRGKG